MEKKAKSGKKKKYEIDYAGILDHSTLDYPGKVSAVVYLCGCSFRCPWCHNRPLVLKENCRRVFVEEIIEQLKDNFLVDAVCITGGEPLMQKTTLKLLEKIRSESKLLIKIDTNGYHPKELKKALEYIDFVSIDVKAPLTADYARCVGMPSEKSKDILGKIKESLQILGGWCGGKEARTTIVSGLGDSVESVSNIAESLDGLGLDYFTLQQFVPLTTLNPEFEKVDSPSRELMLRLGHTAREKLSDVRIVRIATRERGFETV